MGGTQYAEAGAVYGGIPRATRREAHGGGGRRIRFARRIAPGRALVDEDLRTTVATSIGTGTRPSGSTIFETEPTICMAHVPAYDQMENKCRSRGALTRQDRPKNQLMTEPWTRMTGLFC